MALRRTLLLLFAVVFSVLVSAVLYTSAAEGYRPIKSEYTESTNNYSQMLEENLSFPLPIPGTSLIAQQLSSYDGPFLEDGSDREVMNVAALHLYNNSDREILKARVEFLWNGGFYFFEGDHIPPGATVVVLEKFAADYRQGEYLACRGWQEAKNMVNVEGKIAVRDMAMGTVVLSNLTEQSAKNICIYYKSWLSPPESYIGGITYVMRIPLLLPEQTIQLYPTHYAYGYSKVVSISADFDKHA